jgi:N-terminal domain of toast_rack, DUF2154/Cell wall-active antibiotics response 4TMS YvqF
MCSRALRSGAWVAAFAATALAGGAHAQGMRSMTSARQLSGEERQLDVALQYGAGRLKVEPASGGFLYRMEMRYDERAFTPLTEYDRDSGRLRLGVESNRRRGESTRVDREQRATIALTPDVPMELELEFGAGEAEVELGGLSIRDVQIQTGASETRISFSEPNRVEARTVRVEAGAAELTVTGLGNARAERLEFEGGLGETTLDFGGEWRKDASVSIEMGVGSLTLRLPRGVGVRIEKDSFLTSFDAPGMVRRGRAWFSRDYDDATRKLNISIDAALGSIDVQWFDP